MSSEEEAQELKGKYDMREILGSGTSSTVYRAISKRTGEEFAVKVVDIVGEHGDILTQQVRDETLREIAILEKCRGNGHIVRLHEYFHTSTNVFLVMELCRGGELFDYLTQMISLTERKTRLLMRQLFQAVEYIHARNIVHRDLKPENILLVNDMTIKVSDFGFGVMLEEGQQLTDLCGTPSYLAPEVLARSMYEDAPGYGVEVDMWACGVIMYTMLSGAPPFWNRRQMIMLRSIMKADYSFDSPEWHEVSHEAKDLIEKLLVIDPKRRLKASTGLNHPFFHIDDDILHQMDLFTHQVSDISLSSWKVKKFKVASHCIVFILRILQGIATAKALDVESLVSDPYGLRAVRRCIDTAAFTIYRHWVKKESMQSRAALFASELITPLGNSSVSINASTCTMSRASAIWE